jgi:hypothetical protein
MSELHGNINMEKCSSCDKKYLRDFRVRNAQKVHDHKTGRPCDDPECDGILEDTIINFGEGLPEEDLNNGFNHAGCSDLILSMGSSLRVSPAADIPKTVFENNGKLVIVNLQKTPLDAYAALNIHAKCDDVMNRLMDKLNIPIPEWRIVRYCEVVRVGNSFTVNGRDEQHNYYSLFPTVDITMNGDKKTKQVSKKEPHIFKISEDEFGVCSVNLTFKKHYNEIPLKIDVNLSEVQTQMYKITFNPFSGVWESAIPMF